MHTPDTNTSRGCLLANTKASPVQQRFSSPFSFTRFFSAAAIASVLTFSACDPSLAATWSQHEVIRQSVGSSQVIEKGLKLSLPLVAEDGSSVPFSVVAEGALKGAAVERLELFAPGNPTPQIARFEFGQEVAELNLATRIRLSESQTVVAVAHTSDGRVFIAEQPVRVTTSGCIAPAQADASAEMKARVRATGKLAQGASGEILTMISHPMTTGLAKNAQGETPPQRIIQRFEATLDDRPLIKATYFRSMAANPYLKFAFKPGKSGELRLEWTEDTGKTTQVREAIKVG